MNSVEHFQDLVNRYEGEYELLRQRAKRYVSPIRRDLCRSELEKREAFLAELRTRLQSARAAEDADRRWRVRLLSEK